MKTIRWLKRDNVKLFLSHIVIIILLTVLLTALGIVALDWYRYQPPQPFHHWTDDTLIRYISGWWVSLYGVGLFFWWWGKAGKPSFVYGTISFWFLGEWIEKTIQVYARLLRLYSGSTVWSENNWIWDAKGDIGIIAQMLVIVYLTGKIYCIYEESGK